MHRHGADPGARGSRPEAARTGAASGSLASVSGESPWSVSRDAAQGPHARTRAAHASTPECGAGKQPPRSVNRDSHSPGAGGQSAACDLDDPGANRWQRAAARAGILRHLQPLLHLLERRLRRAAMCRAAGRASTTPAASSRSCARTSTTCEACRSPPRAPRPFRTFIAVFRPAFSMRSDTTVDRFRAPASARSWPGRATSCFSARDCFAVRRTSLTSARAAASFSRLLSKIAFTQVGTFCSLEFLSRCAIFLSANFNMALHSIEFCQLVRRLLVRRVRHQPPRRFRRPRRCVSCRLTINVRRRVVTLVPHALAD